MELKKYYLMEKAYSHHFCELWENDDIIRFSDKNLPGMYTTNFTLIKDKTDIYEKIMLEFNKRKNEGNTFLRIETEFPIPSEIFELLPVKPDYNSFPFMTIDPRKFEDIKGNALCIVKEASQQAILTLGMEADIASNTPLMGDFAVYRISRKVEIYQKNDSRIKFYVGFYEGKAIATCEMMIDKDLNMAKIEDFDVLVDYQRRGFGSQMLRHFLQIAVKNKIEAAYVITDEMDTAKVMYEKCGFKTIGKKYELFFNL